MAVYSGQQIRLCDWAAQWQPGAPALIVEDAQFENCTFVGPGVLMFIGGVQFYGNSIEKDALWVVDAERGYQGAVAVRDCVFTGCQFVNVGLATDAGFVREIFETQAGKAQ